MKHDMLPMADFAPDAHPPGSKQTLSLIVGTEPSGRPIAVQTTLIKGDTHRPRLVLTAEVHGDEFEGIQALSRLAIELTPDNLHGTVIIAPIVNPPAYDAFSRVTPIDGLNLNRVFPGTMDGSFTHQLAYQLFHHLVAGADLLVDLHSAGTRFLHGPLAGYYDTQDALATMALRAARAMGFPFLWKIAFRAGNFTYEATRAGVVAVGAELGGGGRCLEAHIVRYYEGICNILKTWGVLPGVPQAYLERPIVVGEWLLAPVSGYLESHVAMEQAVTAGAPLATIRHADSRVLACLTAPRDGWAMGLRTYPALYAGDPAVMLVYKSAGPPPPPGPFN